MKLKQHLIIALCFFLYSTQLTAQKWVPNPASANLLPNNYGVYGIKVVDKDVIWARQILLRVLFLLPT